MKTENDFNGTVGDYLACPWCGEDRGDELVWDDDFVCVTCQSCGSVFDPSCAEFEDILLGDDE